METVVIIGAGASGLACASLLSRYSSYDIIILDQANKVARKVLASGNGRCNVSNENMDIKYYNTNHPVIQNIIDNFDIKDFFDDLKLKLRCDNHLYYPYSLSSLSVKNALVRSLNNVSIILETEVKDIVVQKQYHIKTNQGIYKADKVVIATGSPASHLSGCHNLEMLKTLNVKMIPFQESLVQLKTKQIYHSLKGLRVKCQATLLCNQKRIDEKKGEVLFTDYGLSGICIMQLSRYFINLKGKIQVVLDLLPDDNLDEILQCYDYQGLFHEKLAHVIKNKHIDVKAWSFDIVGTRGIENGQVCHGGVSLDDIDENLQLQKYPNIYIIGEALDVDGDCGGYNLHFAFASGHHVAKKLIEEEQC